MEYRNSFERINNVKDIDYISKEVCKNYNFEKYINYHLIDIGYEDFNYILNTENNKYVVKIFNTDRDKSSCQRLVTILKKTMNSGISVPKLYQLPNKSYIFEINIDNTVLNLIVMEHIEGKNFYELNRNLNNEELEEIAKIVSRVNSIDYDVKEPFYDEWNLMNLKEEYYKKKDFLLIDDNELISRIVKNFEKINFKDLKYAYIHGDVIKANLIKGINNKIYIIDFSGFNYMPRIVELVVILLGLCLTDNKQETFEKMNLFLNYYHKELPLDENEIYYLPLLLNALASMFVIQSSYIKSISGNYIENDYWYNEGKKALNMGMENFKFIIN